MNFRYILSVFVLLLVACGKSNEPLSPKVTDKTAAIAGIYTGILYRCNETTSGPPPTPPGGLWRDTVISIDTAYVTGISNDTFIISYKHIWGRIADTFACNDTNHYLKSHPESHSGYGSYFDFLPGADSLTYVATTSAAGTSGGYTKTQNYFYGKKQ